MFATVDKTMIMNLVLKNNVNGIHSTEIEINADVIRVIAFEVRLLNEFSAGNMPTVNATATENLDVI